MRKLALPLLGISALSVAFSLFSASPSKSFPVFAQKEKKTCAYCHVNPAGGGKRNYRGVYYKQNDKSFASFDDAAEAKKAGEDIGPDATPAPASLKAPDAPKTNGVTKNAANHADAGDLSTLTRKVSATEKAYKAAPKNAGKKKAYTTALVALGSAQLKTKKFSDASETFAKVLAISPKDKAALAGKTQADSRK